jgi:hypothetical protein
MSNLLKHAEEEMRRAGLYDKDSDYGGMIPEAVMKLMRPFAEEGHSGMSASLTLEIFGRLARFKTLTPITNDPAEWMEVSEYMGPSEKGVWQNRRDSSFFSNDGGKTYYSVDDKDRILKTASNPRR